MAVCRAHQPTLLWPPAPAGGSEQAGWRLRGFVMTALRLAWLPGPKSLTPRVVSSYVQPTLLGIPLLATGPGWWDQQGVAHRLSQWGRLMWAWPALSPLAAHSLPTAWPCASCPIPDPRLGPPHCPRAPFPCSTDSAAPTHGPRSLRPTNTHHRLCTTQHPHSPCQRKQQSLDPGPTAAPPSPPTSGHALAGEDLALQPLVHTPRSSTLSHLSPLPRCAPC